MKLSPNQNAVLDFAKLCTADVATIPQLRRWINDYCNDQSGTNLKTNTLRWLIEWAEMKCVDRPMRFDGKVVRIFIVRNFTIDDVRNATPDAIREHLVRSNEFVEPIEGF